MCLMQSARRVLAKEFLKAAELGCQMSCLLYKAFFRKQSCTGEKKEKKML